MLLNIGYQTTGSQASHQTVAIQKHITQLHYGMQIQVQHAPQTMCSMVCNHLKKLALSEIVK